jgi:hypothetical protein
MRDFAEIWQAADKIVYSRTLAEVSTARTRIERHFDPEGIRQLKATTGRDILIGAVPVSPRMLSGQGWSTSATCSWPHKVRKSDYPCTNGPPTIACTRLSLLARPSALAAAGYARGASAIYCW